MFVEQKSPEIRNALDTASIYRKKVLVRARPAFRGERVLTLIDGVRKTKETKNTAKGGDWVITNPSGERYVVSDEAFAASYEPTNMRGIYRASKFCRAIQNPYKKPIKILAPWGSYQIGGEACYIVDTCDDRGKRRGNPYLVACNVFQKTYERYSSL